MDRRNFLQHLAVATAAVRAVLGGSAEAWTPPAVAGSEGGGPGAASLSGSEVDVAGHTLISEFTRGAEHWKVYEDLRTRDGAVTFLSSHGAAKLLTKSAEASFAQATPPYLGMSLEEINATRRDLLADRLLGQGDPDPEKVKAALPPQGTDPSTGPPHRRARWETIVGTKECSDTMPVYPAGYTRTYHPVQFFPELPDRRTTLEDADLARHRQEGLLGGWMPAVRKVFPQSGGAYDELWIFGDVEAHDEFIVQTWHRTVRVENGKIAKAAYAYSYPPFPPAREEPQPQAFYRGLLAFVEYWEEQLRGFPHADLPEPVWSDMSKHAFVKELIVRPRGVYPKYGAVDRDYYGSEYDGFQDTFTVAALANLDWGRFDEARKIIDNYFTGFVDAHGVNNMRGPETSQFGMTLSLMARYFHYTGDSALLLKHRKKIEATARLLTDMHDESLKLPQDDPGYGILRGWSESDSCLQLTPDTWWLPYFANNANSARGLTDLARAYLQMNRAKPAAGMPETAAGWLKRSQALRDRMVARMRKEVRHDLNPPYVGEFAGAKMPFWESLEKEDPSPHRFAPRAYTELLFADMLPQDLANLVVDLLRAYGLTTIGILGYSGRPRFGGRHILAFISHGHGQTLLRLDRIEEFLLFLQAYRYHVHTRGSWVAAEVAQINGGVDLFCMPAQQITPLLVRWMLVLEDSDEPRLYLGKGLPRDWVASGKRIGIAQAPTRWGKVSFHLQAQPEKKVVVGRVELARAGEPREVQVKFRVPPGQALQSATVNGQPAAFAGPHHDTVSFQTRGEKAFEVVARWQG